MRALVLTLVLLAALAPAASAACVTTACGSADTSSERVASGCASGAGADSNDAEAAASADARPSLSNAAIPRAVADAAFVDTEARARTYCVHSGLSQYREIRVAAEANGQVVFLSWWANGPVCQVTLHRSGTTTNLLCPGSAPPQVPALLP